jgi:hypothetical protein
LIRRLGRPVPRKSGAVIDRGGVFMTRRLIAPLRFEKRAIEKRAINEARTAK